MTCGYCTGYNGNARYYTLADIQKFDQRGLWSIREIRFSMWGSLMETMNAIAPPMFTTTACTPMPHNGVSPMTLQECHVDGWTNPDGAIVLSSAPVVMFDCSFTGGPVGQSPVNIQSASQRLVVSENQVTGAPHMIRPGHKGSIYSLPAGQRHGWVKSTWNSTTRTPSDLWSLDLRTLALNLFPA